MLDIDKDVLGNRNLYEDCKRNALSEYFKWNEMA